MRRGRFECPVCTLAPLHSVMPPDLSSRYLVLDGGLATELSARGFDLSDALWSARVLVDDPDAIEAVHFDYFEAGADIAISASYQASYDGFAERGFSPEESTRLLQRSVELARRARDRYHAQHPGVLRPLLVAASVGPYGATRHDGSEYHGNYGLEEEALAAFHRPRLAALVAAEPDLLACETIPSLVEARAIARELRAHPHMHAWLSFTCRDGAHTSAGDAIADCARFLDGEPQVVAMGINCVAPELVGALVHQIAAVSRKSIVVYPNSGEVWNAATRGWEGTSLRFTDHLGEWLDAGARWVGGCCRTTPADIRVVRAIVDAHA